ncbi:MAG TPA: CDP-glucose 4,6-dehydratase, partial [bacterium]|nr:CDP-glucose 4,6-dehydratase [bacterium]
MDLRAFYSGKKVFLTGHTGFKGAWLAWWLKDLGADVTGYSLEPEDTRGNLFNQTKLASALRSVNGDICDRDALLAALAASGAELVFHLAAQPIVLRSYEDPFETYRSNALGTVSLLDAVRLTPAVKTVLVVTTDKCYENREWPWPYRENDELGGRDPYSSSKAMAELAVSAYRRSFLAAQGVGVASARAGNVIGGGDYAPHRIIPDIVEAIGLGRPVVLRHPDSVRPWQHVLDALHGYLILGQRLHAEPEAYAEAFNFSPRDASPKHSVLAVTQRFIKTLGRGHYEVDEASRRGHEAAYLSLDPGKAALRLGWRQLFSTDEALSLTAEW